MNMIELLQKTDPEKIGDQFVGGAMSCPYRAGFEKMSERPCRPSIIGKDARITPEMCYNCWRREVKPSVLKELEEPAK